MIKAYELVSNADGRLSTTATIQVAGFVVLSFVLLIAVMLDRESASELYIAYAAYCGGLTMSKGAVTAYRARYDNDKEQP